MNLFNNATLMLLIMHKNRECDVFVFFSQNIRAVLELLHYNLWMLSCNDKTSNEFSKLLTEVSQFQLHCLSIIHPLPLRDSQECDRTSMPETPKLNMKSNII